MKKHNKNLFLLAGLALSLAGSAKAQSYGYSNGFYWFNIGNAVAIGGYSYASATNSIAIPSAINNLPVTTIYSYAFNGCQFSGVTIPDSVTTIGQNAFDHCANLAGVTISSNVSSIGQSAFVSCSSLKAIAVDAHNAHYSSSNGVLFDKSQYTLVEYPGGVGGSYAIPGTVVAIEGFAFFACPISGITIPASVTSIGELAFESCSGLTNLTIPDGVTNIGQQAFESCSGLTDVTIPGGVTSLGDSVFEDCTGLLRVTLGNGLPRIPDSTFAGDSSLAGITIPDTVGSIGDDAFIDCSRLTSLTIPGSVYSIGQETFYGCTGLTNLILTNGLEYIGEYAFMGCSSLPNVFIPATVTSVAYYAFAGCSSMTAITVDPANSNFSSVNGVLFDKAQTTLVECPGGLSGSYTIPNTVTSIAAYSMVGCNLSSLTVPRSVTSIGDWAISGCPNLASIYFMGNAPSVGQYVFYGDDNYSTVAYYLPGSMGWPGFNYNAGLPVVLWNPLIQASGPNFGVQNHQFGFNITGTNNFTVVVEACTNLASPVWVPLATNTLVGGACYFSDSQWTNYPSRFYGLGVP